MKAPGICDVILLTFVSAFCYAEIINVPGDQPAIQAAINSASNGDTVLVAPGTYIENINFRGKNVVVASEFVFDNDPITIVNTIIDGSSPVMTDTGSCVIINSGEDTTAVLEGFTLTGGIGTKWVDEHGAGVYVEGGGILVQYSSPTIRHNRIIGNFAIRVPPGVASAGGGAIRVGDSTPRILNNIIMDNEGLYGGGIVLNYTGGVVKNNIVANNRVYPAAGSAPTFGGGGLWVWQNFGSEMKIIENNTIVGNSVSGSGNDFAGRGGGILVAGTSATIRNNIVWTNTQTTGGQIGETLSGNAIVTYCDVEGDSSGTGNIDADPLFSDTSYYLQSGSPCIDAGDPDAGYNDPEDPGNPGSALWPAQATLRCDMGAYGGPGSTVLALFVITGVDDGSHLIFPTEFRLEQNYPNPFNGISNFGFRISKLSSVSLAVHDLLGREVATLVNERLSPGNYSRQWDASGYASGVYLYRLRAGDFVETKKLVLIR